jgi:lysophospholipase L1-like esterase
MTNIQDPPIPAANDEGAAPPPRKRNWQLYIVIGGILFCILGEAGLRVFAGRDSRMNIRMGADKEWDPHRGTKLRANLRIGDLVTNSKGTVGGEFDAKKKPGSYRLVCLGDSASVIPPKYTYPAALQDSVRAKLPGRDIDVINASCPGYDSNQSRIWYEREVNDYEHDMLVIYLGWNDMGQYNPDGLAYKLEGLGYLKEPNLFQKMIIHCYLLRSIYVVRDHWLSRGDVYMGPLADEDAKRYTEFYPAHFEKNLLAVIALAKSRGRTVYMCNYAGLVNENPTADEQARLHFPRGMGRQLQKYLLLKRSYETALANISRQTGVPIIDIAAVFDTPEKRKTFTDAAHFLEEGSKLIASKVADVISPSIK